MHGQQNIKTHVCVYVCYTYTHIGFVHGKLTVHCLISRLCNEAYFPFTYILLYAVLYICVCVCAIKVTNM